MAPGPAMPGLTAQRAFSLEVLKEPRGVLRLVQWIFALLAFSTCCHYNTVLSLNLICKDSSQPAPAPITLAVSYPFRLNQQPGVKWDNRCGLNDAEKNSTIYDFPWPGNFSSDAEFFVFTGVISWLFCFASLGLYLFYDSLYTDEQKHYPKVDFVVSVVLAMFWLAGSSAWANGLTKLKNICSGMSVIAACQIAEKVSCPSSCSQFSEGNISVLLGFLNCFLWSANLWFLYKETTWFQGGGQATGEGRLETGVEQEEQEPSPFQ